MSELNLRFQMHLVHMSIWAYDYQCARALAALARRLCGEIIQGRVRLEGWTPFDCIWGLQGLGWEPFEGGLQYLYC